LLSGCILPLRSGGGGAGSTGISDDPNASAGANGARSSRAGGTLRFASHWPYSFDPFYLQELSGIQIAFCLFDPLVRYDYREGKLVGAAAKSWKVTEQGTRFIFDLVEGARFHNGDEVTAADFKYAWERLLKAGPSGVPSPNISYISMIQGAEELMAGEAREATGIRAVDKLTLEVTLNTPFYEFCEVLSYPAFAPVPSKGAAKDFFEFDAMPIGNGAFQMEEAWDWRGNTLRLVRFEEYHGTPALLSAVEFKFFASDRKPGTGSGNTGDLWVAANRFGAGAQRPGAGDSARLSAVATGRLKTTDVRLSFAGGRHEVADSQFRSYEEKTYEGLLGGDIDVAQVPSEELEDARERYGESEDGYTATPGAQFLSGQQLCTQFLWVNFNEEPLASADVRKAISCAINREALCEALYRDTALPASGIIPPGVEGFRDGAWPATTYSIARAKKLLEDAGYPEGKGLGVITLLTLDDEEENKLFELIRDNLEAVGFKVKVLSVTTAELFWGALESMASLALAGWIADFPLAENFLSPLFLSTGTNNQFNYHNEEVDEGIAAARAHANSSERIKAFHEVEDLVSADMPVIPLFSTRHNLLISDRTNDLFVGPDEIADLTRAWLSF
jgi:peptide/nickel transport system substrate-binding protein/oligopeptide transport system substrate-binding protein